MLCFIRVVGGQLHRRLSFVLFGKIASENLFKTGHRLRGLAQF